MPEAQPTPPPPSLPPVGRGAVRSAALLVGLGPEVARAVFSQLSESEVRKIALGAKELRRRSPEEVPAALRAFVDAMEKVGGDVVAGDDLLRMVAAEALGPEVARRAFDGVVVQTAVEEVLGPVAEADPESLAMVLAREQPQTVALVLSSLPPEKAAQVMEFMPDQMRPSIVRRMALVNAVAPDVLREVRQALTLELQAVVAEGVRKVDGRSAALEVLRRTPTAQQNEVLAAIEADDPKLASELRTKLFTFEDLELLADRDIQTLLRDVDQRQLALALKGASAEVKQRFLKNMSTRAGEMLNDEILALGPVRLSDVETAQATIAKKAVELAEAEKITIVRATDKMV
jgi:flagellar motor switch protein FliG